jgi:hypothetical protein
MITIQTAATTAWPISTTVSKHYANRVARLLPRHDADKTLVPFLAPHRDHMYLLDSIGNWTCLVVAHADKAIQLQLSYRHADEADAMESALAHWTVACHPSWRIVRDGGPDGTSQQRMSVDTTFTVAMPPNRRFSREELETITFEIPKEDIGVFIDGELIAGARVVSYSTSDQVHA